MIDNTGTRVSSKLGSIDFTSVASNHKQTQTQTQSESNQTKSDSLESNQTKSDSLGSVYK